MTLPHYSNSTSEEQVDFVDSDLVNMRDSAKLLALQKSKCNSQLDDWDYPTINHKWQKIMAIHRSTAAAYATATIKPQLSSPISSPTPSTSHNSEPVSSPHSSNIIPMAQEQISKVMKGEFTRKTVNRSAAR